MEVGREPAEREEMRERASRRRAVLRRQRQRLFLFTHDGGDGSDSSVCHEYVPDSFLVS